MKLQFYKNCVICCPMSEKKIGKSKYFLKKQKTENLLRIVYFKCDEMIYHFLQSQQIMQYYEYIPLAVISLSF